MSRRSKFGAAALLSAAAAAFAVPIGSSSAHAPGGHHDHGGRDHGSIKHVLLISIDGLHQSDLQWYVANHPGSELARLTGGGAEYTSAHTPVPSDSDPGMTAQMTGGNPRTTGVYYDVEYNHSLLPAGTTSCHGQANGADVIYDSPDDLDVTRLDAGQGLSSLPGSILNMTSTPQDLLNPATFPVDPKTCKPIYPNQYLKVNTIFNVAHDAGLLTAWSDKHPVYTSFNGPQGNGISDSFDPEIDSNALKPDGTPYPGGIAWTGDNAATMQYDSYKVQAVLNWIDGYNHSRTQKVAVPAILGMNFQTVSTAEKLPTSDGLAGGELPGTTTPGPLLARALQYVNDQLADDGLRDPRAGPGRLDGDHRLRQARAVPAGSQPADADRRHADHRRGQCRVGGEPSGGRPAGRRRDRRRRDHVVAVRSLTESSAVREALPVDPHGDG